MMSFNLWLSNAAFLVETTTECLEVGRGSIFFLILASMGVWLV